MKKIILILLIACTIYAGVFAQAAGTTALPVSQQLYKFSPIGEIIVRNLGMEDKNGNGVIDEFNANGSDAGEGYRKFVERYGTGKTYEEKRASIDSGFYANGVIYGAGNKKLEEPEMVNYYYINIRFKKGFEKETEDIDSEIKTYVYANNIPLVWLDDKQGTVMKAVNEVLGANWLEKWDEWVNDSEKWQDKTEALKNADIEAEAVKMFNRGIQGIRVRGLTGDPGRTGYYTLPEFINRKAGYCFEAAQFGFWFFSKLKVNSISVETSLTAVIQHQVTRLGSGKIIDYFGSSTRYRVSPDRWNVINPIMDIGMYYSALIDKMDLNSQDTLFLREQSIAYNKYSLVAVSQLMYEYYNTSNPNYANVIELGEFIIQNIDIAKIATQNHSRINPKENLTSVLQMLLGSYFILGNTDGLKNITQLINTYYSNDSKMQSYLNHYIR